MDFIFKSIYAINFLLLLFLGLIFIGDTIALIHPWVGFFAYIIWFLVAPILSPAIFALPWFDAWVKHTPVNHLVLSAWILLIICLAIGTFIAARFDK